MSQGFGPLELSELSEAARKAAGPEAPSAVRMMAARGLMPLGPRDLAIVLFQIAATAGEADLAVGQAARETAGRLPDKILAGFLGERLPPAVLDFFGRVLGQARRGSLLEALLLNPGVADETVAFLASAGAGLEEAQLEIIITNEQRLLRCPDIVAALYLNPRARMSSVDRAVELCVRNGVRVEGIPNFDEIVQALDAEKAGGKTRALGAHDDDVFRAEVSGGVDGPPLSDDELAQADREAEAEGVKAEQEDEEWKRKPLSQCSLRTKLRLATMGKASQKLVLVRDPNKMIAMSVIKSPGMTDREVGMVVQSRQVCGEVIRYISNHREWMKSYGVRLGLCGNPKTPIATTLRLLPHLRNHDLKALGRSKSIPGAVANAARELIQKRG